MQIWKSWLLWLFKSALTLIIWLLLVEIRTIKISWFANCAWFSTVLQIRIRVRIRDGSDIWSVSDQMTGVCTAWPLQKWRDLVRKIRTHASRIRDGAVSDQISGFPYANPGTKIGGTSRQTNPRRIRDGSISDVGFARPSRLVTRSSKKQHVSHIRQLEISLTVSHGKPVLQ